MDARDALSRLAEGNRRFVGEARETPRFNPRRPGEPIAHQAPIAIIVGCSDARVPAEIVFDQGIGDLFVIRVAGNVVAPSQVGSVEFAAERFGTQLVVVLGHSHCGAVEATLEELHQPGDRRSPNLRSIVDRIRPAVEPLMDSEREMGKEALLEAAVRANVRSSVMQLEHGSSILEDLIARERLLVVGAEYSLGLGTVKFFDGVAG